MVFLILANLNGNFVSYIHQSSNHLKTKSKLLLTLMLSFRVNVSLSFVKGRELKLVTVHSWDQEVKAKNTSFCFAILWYFKVPCKEPRGSKR